MRTQVIFRSRATIMIVASAVASSSLSPQAGTSPAPLASVTGTVVDSLHGGYLRDAVVRIIGPDGAPIARARVAIENETKVALTDENGAFMLGGLRAGTRDVSVRALGFQPTETVVALRTGSSREVELRMQKYVPVLNTVTVAAVRNAALERVGFSERKSAASG